MSIVITAKVGFIQSECEVDQTDYFCPNCGTKAVFIAKGDGDYYIGPDHYCMSCRYVFTLATGSQAEELKLEIKP